MAGSGTRFAADIGRLLTKYEKRAEAIGRQAAQSIAESVIVGGPYGPGTPIDTGFARASWYAALNQDPQGGPSKPEEGTASGGAAQVASVVASAKAGDLIRIINSAAYARRLEYGHSKQAGSGMVRVALAQFEQAVADAAKMVKASGG